MKKIFCVSIILFVCLTIVKAQTNQISKKKLPLNSQTPKQVLQIIEKPKWWIVPFQEGNTNEGRLYFGVVLENLSDSTIQVGVSFQSYSIEGTKLSGCYGIGGDSPGVTIEIAPKEKALAICNRSIVLKDIQLQVTARIWNITPQRSKSANVQILETGINLEKTHKTFFEYNAFARVKTTVNQDTKAKIVFRFYNEDGVQVAMCETDSLLVEPEILLRATCSNSINFVTGNPQPKTVRAEAKFAIF